ncbi:MAG: hypothetical protein KDA24_19065 [Deltaproteobacteria bacterium]|nr:hypothetical protein [Deltaproteobacteria bacterium]
MRRTVAFLLVLLCLGYLGLDRAWLAADEGIQTTDAAYHFSRVAALRAKLLGTVASGGFDGQRYGGLVYYAAALVSLVTGLAPARLLMGLAVLLRPLLVVGIYRLGWELGREGQRETTGLLAAALALMLPGLVNYGRVLVLDLPLTVAVAWAVGFALTALRLEHEGSPPAQARLGFVLCVVGALLIKFNALAFLLGPAWVIARQSLRRAWQDRRKTLGTTAALLGAGALVAMAGLLLGARGDALQRTLVEATWPGALLFGYLPEGSASTFLGDWFAASRAHSWEATYYTWLQTLSPPWALAGGASFFWFFGRRHGCEDPLGHSQRDLAFWWFIVPVLGVVFVLRGLYDERYVLPLLPLTAALIATAAMDLRPPWLRRGLVALALLGGALNHGFVHHDVWPTARPLACVFLPAWADSERVGDELWTCFAYPEYRFMDRAATPSHLDINVADVDDLMEPIRDALDRPLRAVFLDDLYDVFYALFQESLLSDAPVLQHQHMLLLTDCWDREHMRAVFETADEVENQILLADVVVMRWGTPTDGHGLRGKRCEVFWKNRERFEDAGEASMPDGTAVRVWRAVGR